MMDAAPVRGDIWVEPALDGCGFVVALATRRGSFVIADGLSSKHALEVAAERLRQFGGMVADLRQGLDDPEPA